MRFQIGQQNQNYTEAFTEIAPVQNTLDATAASSNKTFTVPNGEMWMLNWASVTLTSTATVGNRQMVMQVLNAAGTAIIDMRAGAVQAASLTYAYDFLQGIYRETAFTANEIQVPVPTDLYLPAGYSLKFYDSAAIAPSADSMTVAFQVKQYKGA